MTDISTISAFLTSIKTATELAKALKDVDTSLEQAELKLRIVTIIEALLDAKIAAVEVQEILQAKDSRIFELEETLKFKGTLIRHLSSYYETDGDGNPQGDPYCSHCWEVEKKAVHLIKRMTDGYECPRCKNTFGYRVKYPLTGGAPR